MSAIVFPFRYEPHTDKGERIRKVYEGVELIVCVTLSLFGWWVVWALLQLQEAFLAHPGRTGTHRPLCISLAGCCEIGLCATSKGFSRVPASQFNMNVHAHFISVPSAVCVWPSP